MQKYGGDQKYDMLTPSIDVHKLRKAARRCNRRANNHGDYYQRYDNVAWGPRNLRPCGASPLRGRKLTSGAGRSGGEALSGVFQGNGDGDHNNE